MELNFEASSIKKTDKNGKNEVLVTIAEDKTLDFLNAIMADPLVASFLADSKTKTWFSQQIGVTGLLEAYSKQEVLEKVGWDYVKEFFMDHMNTADILNHLGYETVREHFSDKINAESTQNDINTVGNKSVLGMLDEGNNQ